MKYAVLETNHWVSSEISSQVSETSPKMAGTNRDISGHVTLMARINVSDETREANVVEGQSYHTPSLLQLQVTGGPQ